MSRIQIYFTEGSGRLPMETTLANLQNVERLHSGIIKDVKYLDKPVKVTYSKPEVKVEPIIRVQPKEAIIQEPLNDNDIIQYLLKRGHKIDSIERFLCLGKYANLTQNPLRKKK